MGQMLKRGAIGCAGLIGVIVVIAVIATLASQGGKSSKNAGAGQKQNQTATTVAHARVTNAAASPNVAMSTASHSTRTPAGSSSTATPVGKTATPASRQAQTPAATHAPAFPSFGSGQKIVGTDIQPGTYRSAGGDGCYWERESGFSGSVNDILANDNATGPAVVTIAPSDKGFKSTNCARWVASPAPVTKAATAPFGQGTYVVGVDIAPGTWRASGGANCYWARIADFSGSVDSILANDNATGSAIVQIAPTDKGFTSRGCGTWTKIQ